jgi:hypothetical protein
MAPLPAAPDAWSARNHKSRVTRSKKRGASFKVDRVGMSPVIGDRYNVTAPYDVDAVDALSLIERVAVSRDLVALAAHRLVCGAVGLDVQLVTDKHYRGHGLEPLVGTEVGKSYTVALSRQIDRSDVPHAAGSKGLSGWAHLSDLDEIAAPVTAFKVNVKKHGARLKVPALTLRDSEAPAERLFICHPRDGITSYTALTAPSHDYAAGYWRGHTFTPRGASAHHGSRQVRETETVQVPFTLPAVHRGRWNASATRWDAVAVMPERVVFKLKTVNVTKSVTAARTVNTAGELVECETPAGVATAACLNRGERVVLSVCGVKVTVTRGKGKAGTYAVNAGKERGKVGGLRTVDSVAVHALKLSA